MDTPQFNKHQVEWNDEKVHRFWDFFVKNSSLLNLSFAHETGKDIVKRTKKYLKSDGVNLDYGCGGGALMGYLFEEGIACQGLDSSTDSLAVTKQKFGDNPLYKGLIHATAVPEKSIHDNTYDFVYFIETIEHILPQKLAPQLEELCRITKPDGYVFVSTPHNEDMQRSEVLCPDCGAIFHRVQHMNSFTVPRMSALMEDAGFETVLCEATFLGQLGGWNKIKKIVNTLRGNVKKPHLIYIGRKK